MTHVWVVASSDTTVCCSAVCCLARCAGCLTRASVLPLQMYQALTGRFPFWEQDLSVLRKKAPHDIVAGIIYNEASPLSRQRPAITCLDAAPIASFLIHPTIATPIMLPKELGGRRIHETMGPCNENTPRLIIMLLCQ